MCFFLLLLISLLLLLLLLLVEVEPSVSITERCHPNEKTVLLKIKKAFNSSQLSSWDPNTDCCEWYNGVYCEPTNDYHVTSIYFLFSDFTGTIPDAIGDLPYLTSIRFQNINALSGPIPFSITKLHNLKTLQISFTNVKGPIPGFLSKLKNLSYLDLSSNKLTGRIPSFLSDLPDLISIDVSKNRLSGTIPESLVKLKDNGLYLLLSHNKLSGEIPPSFGAINFNNVDLSYNNLRGDISMLFGPNKTISYLNVARNKFEFNMTDLELHSITELDIRHNNIYGSLPKDMINIKWKWMALNVSYNRLCGPIPQGGNLQTNFDYSSFFHNRCLCGAPLTVACK